jgi:hypothetical protein
MRYFLRRRIPPFERVLLVESGSRNLLENLLNGLYASYPEMQADLVTCYAGVPQNFSPAGRVYRVADYAGRKARRTLYAQLGANDYQIIVLICSGEPIMTKWKFVLGARLAAKLLVLNENGDYFFFDRSNLHIIRELVLIRAGLYGADATQTLLRLLVFPFAFLYLVAYAATVHLRRKLRTL